jgi:DMSO/TMAO reductase YedYZ heme-binding membrane subunit
MEKKILQYCYWLGFVCLAVAIVWRAVDATQLVGHPIQFLTVTYTSFYKGALLFLLCAIATQSFIAGKRT